MSHLERKVLTGRNRKLFKGLFLVVGKLKKKHGDYKIDKTLSELNRVYL